MEFVMQPLARITEKPLSAETVALLPSAGRQGLAAVGLDAAAEPKAVIEAVDQFVFDWQEGKRPPADKLDAEDAPFALGSLWGEQLVRRFGWEWALMTFHDHGNSVASGVVSPDRALAVYPIHFLMGAMKDAGVDVTIALSYNMLEAGKLGKLHAREYVNLMDVVQRIVPRR
jgi:hypothetical protein